MYKTLPKNVISFFPHFPHFEIFSHIYCKSSYEIFKDWDYIKFVLERKIQQIDNADISC